MTHRLVVLLGPLYGRLQGGFSALRRTQQRLGDLRPFTLKRVSGRWLAGTSIPISRIRVVTLLAMQVGMNPCTVETFVLLSRFVRSLPIALGIQPQTS